MTAREKFAVGDRVQIAGSHRISRGSRFGVVVGPWPKYATCVRVRRDGSGRITVDGMDYWKRVP